LKWVSGHKKIFLKKKSKKVCRYKPNNYLCGVILKEKLNMTGYLNHTGFASLFDTRSAAAAAIGALFLSAVLFILSLSLIASRVYYVNSLVYSSFTQSKNG